MTRHLLSWSRCVVTVGMAAAGCAHETKPEPPLRAASGSTPPSSAAMTSFASVAGSGSVGADKPSNTPAAPLTNTLWPMCKQGFVHASYDMLGKEHTTFMDMEVVASIANWIKLQRQ